MVRSEFVFEHLSQQHLERLQHKREELERTINLLHQIERGKIQPTLKNYWLVTERERNILKREAGVKT